MNAICVRGQRQVESIIDRETHVEFSRQLSNRFRPTERRRIRGVLGSKLNKLRPTLTGRPGLLDGIQFPAGPIVGENHEPSHPVRHSRLEIEMPRSTTFLRSVFRLIPRSAAART